MSIINPGQQKLLLADVGRLEKSSFELLEGTLLDAEQSLPFGFRYSIQKRKVSGAYQFYWRLSSGSQKRNYLRLSAEVLQSYLDNFDIDFRLRIKGIEQNLQIINANLKYISCIRALIAAYGSIDSLALIEG